MWLERYAWQLTSVALAIFVTIAAIDHLWFSVGGIAPPDAHLFGIPEESLTIWLESIRKSKRIAFFALHTFTLDLLLPYVLLAAFTGLTLRFANGGAKIRKIALPPKIALAAIFPGLYALADNYENLMVAGLLEWYPETFPGVAMSEATHDRLVWMLQTATSLKFILFGLSTSIVIAAFFVGRHGNSQGAKFKS